MRVYALAQLGNRVRSDRSASSDELRVLDHLAENKTASEDQLEVCGADIYTIRSMKSHGLIMELTQ